MSKTPLRFLGLRLTKLRQHRGWLRADLAKLLRVDVSSIAGWENGKHQPRERQQVRLAKLFGVDRDYLFPDDPRVAESRVSAAAFDVASQAPALLVELTEKTHHRLRGFRLTERCETPVYQYTAWRELVCERLRANTLIVDRVEVVTGLQRLKEILANILHYTGMPYHVRICSLDGDAPLAVFSGYAFDDDQLLLSMNWSDRAPGQSEGLHVVGMPFSRLFHSYWSELWRRGTFLNPSGAHNLSEVRKIAWALGLPKKQWHSFVEEARTFRLPDGAPPLP